MIKMFHYMKERWYYIVLIIALLFLQANCDLALPDYTSKIVNIGIQQKGIEDGVPEKIREESMEKLFLFMEDKDVDTVKDAYTLKGDIYKLKEINKDEREKLNSIFGMPMMAVESFEEGGDQVKQIKEKMQLPEDADLFQVFSQMPKEQLLKMMDAMTSNMKDMPDSIVTQAAVQYVQQEYEGQGIDVDQMQIRYILMSGLKMLGLALVIMVAAISVTFLSARVAAILGRNLRNGVYRKVISFSGEELNHFSTASLITRSTNDIQQVQQVFAMIFRIVLYAPILGIGGVLKVLQTDASMTWILGVAVAAIIILVGLLFSIAMPKFTKLQYLIDELNLVSREILTGIPVIRAFSREKHEEARFEDANERLTKTNLFVNRCMTFMMPAMMLIMNGITILIVYNGAHAVDNGTMQVGNMMAFMQYAMQIIMSFLMITMMSIMLPRASVAAKRINEVMGTKVSILDGEAHALPDKGAKGEVRFEHVGFSYPGADEETLTDIDFSAHKGETVAFIGSTGSGKSTLVNLIPRFFDVSSGRILVDGVDVRDMKLTDLRDRIGYVPQKGVLFSGTIDSNIRYGKEDATDAEVQRAAEVAQAWDFIQEKEEKVDSEIAQGGTNVSGGQKQRLSIARAIAKRPEIYIFDDSFSALDYKTDMVLRRALKKETKDATTLIVAQRISTILHADRILVLDEGRVVGQGTHKELLKSCEVYRQIAMSQLSEEELANE
ncbi:ABC transporter ATP-binding protein/permease [Blautia coccoides]|uniref:ABC transporter ATP-binding protein n=1 Tax=Blautia producta TaxID=33035 RepID=UPI002149DE6A|nr:ABC transporter ATP-binding protein [Blautia coccoides]MCR1986504.1 ABC transporter ATP-binding protein/permease [Blautia coccoides]MDU5219885.1 ABC transporter ATP-binding protein [Blautia producta]MDU5381643.1 ABC transporter ATP-binding protein [Blautia producta]MDU6882905.1 ABC transporter ATP-binding protein [Blautia producta]